MQEATEDKYIKFPFLPTSFENPIYEAELKRSFDKPEEFWAEQAEDLVWTKKPTVILDKTHPFIHRWYADGEMNMCYNCIDRHVDEGRGHYEAIAYVSAYTGVERTYTYSDMKKEVGRLASIL